MSYRSLNARRGKSIVILAVLLFFAIFGVSAFIPQTFASSATPLSSTSAVSCSPSPVYVGSTTTCTATTVSSSSLSGTVITFSSSSTTGTFGGYTSSCTIFYSSSSCSVTYSDSTPGTYFISASTGSGGTNDLGSFSLTVIAPPATSSVQCSPYPIYAYGTTTCTATIAGVSSGSVQFTTTSNSGTFPSTAYGNGYCTLVDYSCSVTYYEPTAGTYSITASYLATYNSVPISATFSLTVLNPQSGVGVVCYDFTVGSSTTCTATVARLNFYISNIPTGLVSFTSTSATGSFVNNQCTLSFGSCSVTYRDTTAGTYSITATYSGDQSNPPSSATYPVIVSLESAFSITTSNGANVCTPYYFAIQVTWDAATNTCTSSSTNFAINGVEIFTIGSGVTLVSTGTSGTTSAGGGVGFYNYGGTINNYGTIIATGGNGADGGFGGYAASCPAGVFVGSNGAPGGGGGTGGDGVYNYNYGTINNYGTITGQGGNGGNGGQGGDGGGCTVGTPGDGGRGGDGGVPGSDIYNLGTINNYGTITSTVYLSSGGSCDGCGGTGGTGGNGGGGENYGQGGNGASGGSFITNPGTINNYATITGTGGSGGSGGIGGGGYDFLGLGTPTTYGGGNGGSGGYDIQNSGTINNYATITGYGGNGGTGAPGNDAGHLTTANCPDCYSGTGGNGGNGGTAISNTGTINNYGSFLSSSFAATSATSSQTTFDVMKGSGTTNIKGKIDVTGGNPANGGAYGVSGGANGGTNPNNGTPNGIAGNGGYGFANNGIVNNYATTTGTGGQSNTVYFSSGTYGIYNSAGSVIDNLGVIESSNAAQGDYNTYNLGTINNDGLFNYGLTAGYNAGAVTDYCDFGVSFDNTAPTSVSCNTVSFGQNLGYTPTWGVTSHWGPFTVDYRGTGSVAVEQIAGTLTYSYDNANDSGRIYQCYSSACSNTIDYPATITVTYGNPTSTSVSCSPAISYPGSSIECTATVNSAVSPTPTGTVSFVTHSSTGTFVNNVCTLSAGSCSVYYSDTTTGTHTLTAYYIGDTVNAPSSVTSSVAIDKAVTSTSVSCQSLNVALSTKCTATVNSAASPTGTVSFTDIPYAGSFTPSSGQCTLSAGSCSVTYSISDSYSGPPTVTASYAGDSLNNPSSGISSPTTMISITISDGATFCPDYLFGNWDAITHTCSSPTFYFPGAIINIAAGVTLSGIGVTNTYSGFVPGFNSSGTVNNYGTIQSIGGINNLGTVNNYGTVQSTGGSSSSYSNLYGFYSIFYGVENNGTINNLGNMSGTSVTSSTYVYVFGIDNSGTINNVGNLTGSSSADGGSGISYAYGIENSGTINNAGTMSGTSSGATVDEYGIDNLATINNAGTLAGTSSGSGYTIGILDQIYYVNFNSVTPSINDYCGATISSNGAAFTPDHSYSCNTVSFTQSGLPSGVSWGVTTSWGPFILPMDHTSTLSTITMQLTGSLNYTYDSPVATGSQTYECSYGCSGTMSSGTSFSAYYSLSPISCTPSPLSIGPTTTCTITFQGSAPTGPVTFTSSSSTGSFTPSSGQCTLSAGSCSVSYSDLAAGAVTITALYSNNNVPSSDAFILTVVNSIGITTSDGATICPDLLSGAWNSASDICSSGTSGFVINAGSSLDIGAGVTISGTSNSGSYGINNYGTVNNSGTLSGASSYPSGDDIGIGNNGIINNYGTINGSNSGTFTTTYATASNYGIYNNGTINNVGTISGTSSARDYDTIDDYGIYNNGTINNAATMNGVESAAYVYGYGIYNNGTINNAATMSGTSTGGGSAQGVYDNYDPYSNPAITATINNYCTVSETSNGQQNTYGTYDSLSTFYSIIPLSCSTVSFTQSGLPSGVSWGVTTSWGPFILPVDHTGTLSTITMQLTGSLNYTYDSPVTSSGISYDCSTGCSGSKVTGVTSFNAAYSIPLTISCPSSPAVTGSLVSCTVLVTDFSSSPTAPSGTITFSSNPTITSLNLPASCQLSGLSSSISSCTVSFTPVSGSQASYNITAYYSGDSAHSASSDIAAFVVQQPNTAAQGSSTIEMSGGSASSNQTSTTGVSVTITGSSAPVKTNVTITTEDLSSPSTNVATSTLTGPLYYDVSVDGITDGTAQVCVTSSTATSLQYWDGGGWANATSITVSGSAICGNIPVSALTGTNIVIGGTLSPPTVSPSLGTIDQGQTSSLTSTSMTTGTGPYTHQWYVELPGATSFTEVNGATSSSYSFVTTASNTTGTYSFKLQITDSSLTSVNSSVVSVILNTALGTPTITPSASVIDSDQSISVAVSWTGGTSPYTVTLYSSSTNACSASSTLAGSQTGVSGSSATFSGISPSGNSYYCATVTDSATQAVTTTAASLVTVNPKFAGTSVTIAKSKAIDSGQSIALNVTWTNAGTSPYTVQLETSTSSSCASPTNLGSALTYVTGTSTKFTVSPSSETYYCATVTDSATTTESSSTLAAADITVNPALASVKLGSFTTSPQAPGSSDSITVSWTGGTTPYNVTLYYSTSSAACSSSDMEAQQVTGVSSTSATLTFTTPSTGGVYYYCAIISDTANALASSPTSGSELTVSYSVTFNQNGIPSNAWGVKVGTTDYPCSTYCTGSSLVVSGLVSSESYSYYTPVAGSAGTQYVCSGCSGTVSPTDNSVGASYSTQYLLTVTSACTSTGGGIYYYANTVATVTTQGVCNRSSGSGTRIASYSLNGAISLPESTTGIITIQVTMNAPQAVAFNSVTQYEVSLDSGATSALNSITPPTISGDNYWYDSGTPITLVLNGVYGRSIGTGSRVTGYEINAGTNTPETTSSTFTVLSALSIAAPQSITTTTTTQYYLTDNNPSGAESSITPSTIAGDTGWYDQGTSVVVSLNNVYGATSTQRDNLFSYTLDATATPVTRAGSETQSFNVLMGGAHTISSTYNTQFLLTVTSAYGKISITGSQTGDNWFDNGSSATFSVVSPVACGTGCQEFFIVWTGSGTASYSGSSNPTTITVGSAITETASFVTQYLFTFEYTLSGGGSPTAPTVSYTSGGVSETGTVSPSSSSSPTQAWVDSGTSVTYTNPLVGSGTSERWQTDLTILSGSSVTDSSVSTTETLNPTYYHQFSVTWSYITQDGSTPSPAPTFSGTQYGSSFTGGSSGSDWLDATTLASFQSSIPSSPTNEIWTTSPTETITQPGYSYQTSITLGSGSTILATEYYHQYLVTASYSTSDGSTPSSSVVLTGTTFGGASTTTLNTTPQITWLDAGTGWSVNNPITAPSTPERWYASSGTAGTISAATTISPEYDHEFLLTIATDPSGLSPSPSITPQYSSGWYSYDTPVTVAANTVSGYTFIVWQVDGTNGTVLANSITITMDQTHSLVAYYEQPTNALQTLISNVNGMHLQQGAQTSLDANLNAALSSLNSSDTKTATNQLNAFLNEVSAQSGKHISTQQAQLLTEFAQNIINSIAA